jgi:hypothetical protein
MELVLNTQDLDQLDKIIQETPFKYSYPLFQFLRTKIQQQQKENSKQENSNSLDNLNKNDNG